MAMFEIVADFPSWGWVLVKAMILCSGSKSSERDG
jgi:hypothetical protein